MKLKFRYLTGLLPLMLMAPATAEVIYSNFQNIAIPTDFTGVTVDVAGGTINPFFGGVGVANNDLLQPIRSSASNLGTLRDFTVGSTIDASQLYLATGYGGSQDHLGSTFTAGQEGYLGFKLNGSNYGWMRVVFTANTSGGEVNPVIKDWAYDNSGAAIVTGNVLQSAVVGGAQTFTLNSASGSFTLGSQITDTSGNTNSVVKTGAGTTILTGTNSYSGTTTVDAGALFIASSATTGGGAVSVNNAGTKLMGSGTVGGSTTINSGAILAPGNSVGKETFSSNLTLGSGSIFEWELASTPADTGRGTSYDALNVAGTLGGSEAIFRVVLDGAQTFSEAFWDANHTWTDIFMSADAGDNLSYQSIFSNVQYWNSNTGNLGMPTGQGGFTITGSSLVWTAVPEPTGALAGMLLGAGLLRRRRKTTSEASPQALEGIDDCRLVIDDF